MRFLKQVRHVFQKDLLRFWPGLLGVAALGGFHRLVGLPPTYSLGIPFAGDLPLFSLAVVALAAMVVQDDPAGSQDAHWRTTPLSPSAVFTAKSVFLGLFLCLIPALLQAQWVASLGPAADLTGMILDALLFQGGLLAAVALGASITPNLGAFLSLAVATWFGIQFFESSMMVRGGERWPGAGEMLTRAWVMHLSGLVIGGSLFLHQYLTRHVVRTAAFSVAAFGGVAAGLWTLQPDWASGPLQPEDRVAYEGVEAIDLHLTQLTRSTPATSGARQDWVVGTFAASGPGLYLRPTRSRTLFAGPSIDLTTEIEDDARWSSPAYDPGWSYPGMEPAGVGSRYERRPNSVFVPFVHAAPAAVNELHAATGLTTSVDFDAFRFTTESRLRLVKGETRLTSAGRLRVQEVARGDRTMNVEVLFDAAPRALSIRGGYTAGTPGGLVLHNTKYNQYLVSTGSGGGRSFQRPRALTGGARYVSHLFTFAFNAHAFEALDVQLQDDWFEDVELLVIGFEYAGSLARTVEIELNRWPDPGERIDLDPLSGR